MDPLTLASVLSLLKRFALPLALVMALTAAWHLNSRAVYWHNQSESCQTQRKADQANFTAAVKAAQVKNQEEVKETETKWKGVVSTTEKTYDTKLQAAYASAAAYADRLRKQTTASAASGTGSGDLPQATGPSASPDGTSSSPLVFADRSVLIPVPETDLNICAENTVKAESWQIFWKGIKDAGR